MTDSEIHAAFGGWSTGSPQWKAICAILDGYVAQETEPCGQRDLSSEARHYNSGRLARAIDTRDDILGIMEKVKKNEPHEAD